MSRVGRTGRAAATILAAALLAGGGLVPATLAVGPDKAEVVLVFDFSASILNDATSRNQFGAALERIADRVDETQRDLIGGDTSVSIVRFASKAADYKGCTDLHLLGSPATVRKFADCLRSVATAYRKGLDPALEKQIGKDTNYVAAMEAAAAHLPKNAVRPTMIFFSDGKHDVAGVPVSQVAPAKDRLFGSWTPFALLPVGMGLDPAQRGELKAGLERLRTIKDMPPCTSGTTFDWPDVVFESPDQAGTAVAVALQNATCTFTAAPVAPSPTPSTDVRAIRLKAGDGKIEVAWSAPNQTAQPITDYRVRCTADGGDPVESTEGVSLDTQTVVEGLTNGTAYRCEVAAVSGLSEGAWTPASATATPTAVPAPPAKPAVEGLDGAVRISVKPDDSTVVSIYHYECSADNGTTWTGSADVPGGGDTRAQIGRLANGVAYVCRAFATNDSGTSEASPLSDAVRPCRNVLECNGLTVPLLAGVAGVLAGALLLALFVLTRGRGGGYTVAVVDVVHTANLGGGSNLGIRFERDGRLINGILAARGRKADIRIRKHRGDAFEVRDSVGTHVVASGEPVVIVHSGTRHELVLRAFEGRAASAVSVRR